MKKTRKKKSKRTRAVTLHKQLESALGLIKQVSQQMLDSSKRLSQRSHRGKQCKTCKRPEANVQAYEDLTSDGDGPDLCWGFCSEDKDD